MRRIEAHLHLHQHQEGARNGEDPGATEAPSPKLTFAFMTATPNHNHQQLHAVAMLNHKQYTRHQQPEKESPRHAAPTVPVEGKLGTNQTRREGNMKRLEEQTNEGFDEPNGMQCSSLGTFRLGAIYTIPWEIAIQLQEFNTHPLQNNIHIYYFDIL